MTAYTIGQVVGLGMHAVFVGLYALGGYLGERTAS